MGGNVTSIKIAPDSTIYLISSSSLLISHDLGHSWVKYSENFVLGMDMNSTGNVYLIEKNGQKYDVVLLTESGSSKIILMETTTEPKYIRCNNNGKIIIIDNGNHFYISTDDGNSWQEKLLPSGDINCILLTSEDIILSTYSVIFRSSDNADTWQEMGSITATGPILQKVGDKLYASTGYTLSVSSDNGISWSTIWSIKNNNLKGIVNNISVDIQGNIFLCVGNGIFRITSDDTVKYLGITDNIYDAACIGDLIFAISDNSLYKHDPSLHPYMGKNYFPLHIGNWWQCLDVKMDIHSFLRDYFVRNYYIDKDTVIDNMVYYVIKNVNEANTYVDNQRFCRYDQENQKVYEYKVNQYKTGESLLMDFNLIEGDSINGDHVIMGESNLFGHKTNYKGSYRYTFNWIHEYESYSYYYENFGYLDAINFLQCNLVYEDSTILYSYNYAPKIIITPVDTITSSVFNLSFFVTHHLSICDTMSLFQYFNYVDTVLFKSRYVKQNSIINVPDTVLINQPRWLKYNFLSDLDTALLNQGYDFCYRIEAKDKGIKPHYSYFPDTGYYKVSYRRLTGVEEDDLIDKTFYIAQNYPNPFNPATSIEYHLPAPANVLIEIFDVLGRRIKILLDERENTGIHTIQWNANEYAGGVYFCRIRAGKNVRTIKMSLIK
jgi:hypothetical protein